VLHNGGVRTVLDFVATYTGIKNLTLGANVDYGWRRRRRFSRASPRGRTSTRGWWGYAGYVAYDWTEKLRTAFRGKFFSDPMGSRTGAGQKVDLWEMTKSLNMVTLGTSHSPGAKILKKKQKIR